MDVFINLIGVADLTGATDFVLGREPVADWLILNLMSTSEPELVPLDATRTKTENRPYCRRIRWDETSFRKKTTALLAIEVRRKFLVSIQ